MGKKKETKQIKNAKETLEPKNMAPESNSKIFSDVLGSYTGVPQDGEEPIQDADDL